MKHNLDNIIIRQFNVLYHGLNQKQGLFTLQLLVYTTNVMLCLNFPLLERRTVGGNG